MDPIASERGVVIDWLLKLVIGIAILGVIVFDAGSIMVNYFTLDSGANDVAIALSTEISSGARNRNSFTDLNIYDMAKEMVEDPEIGVKGAKVVEEGTGIDPASGVVTVVLKRTADTIVVSRIGAIEHWATATAEGTSGTT